MSKILSAIMLVVLVCFAANINKKTKELRNSGASEVEIDFTNGSICARINGTWNCDNIYIIKLEGKNGKSKN